jgi:hypothetical protein
MMRARASKGNEAKFICIERRAVQIEEATSGSDREELKKRGIRLLLKHAARHLLRTINS